MKSSITLIYLFAAGLLSLSVLAFAEGMLSKNEEEFVKKCAAECRKNKRTDCGDIRGQLVKFVTASSMMSENNPLAFEDMNSAGNRLSGLCPDSMSNRGF